MSAALALAWNRAAGFVANVWPKIVLVAGVTLALLGVYAVARRSGREAERADALAKGLDIIQRGNTAARHLDHAQEAIDRDPNNLDRLR